MNYPCICVIYSLTPLACLQVQLYAVESDRNTLRQTRSSSHLFGVLTAALCDSFQVNCWPSSQTTSTTATTSAWRTWCTTWPRRTGLKPKTSSTHGSSPSYSPSPVWSQSPCSAPSAQCRNRPTTSASCTPPRSTKATARLTPCTSRVRRDTSPGTARRAARASGTQRCLCPPTRSSTVDTCHRCRDSITTTSTSSVTRTQTRSVCTVRSTPCKYFCYVLLLMFLFIYLWMMENKSCTWCK